MMGDNRFKEYFARFGMEKKRYFCPVHGVFEAFIDLAPVEYKEYCPKCQEEEAKIRRAAVAKEVAEAHHKALISGCGVPDIFLDASLDNFVTGNQTQSLMLNRIKSLVTGHYKTITMIGTPGVGKTHLMCAAISELTKVNKICKYVTESDIVREIKQSFNKTSKDSEAAIIERYVEPDLLCIDELRGTEWSQWDGIVLADIIDKRWQKLTKRTILAGNISIDQLKAHFEDRTLSRLQANGDILQCISEDWRKKHE